MSGLMSGATSVRGEALRSGYVTAVSERRVLTGILVALLSSEFLWPSLAAIHGDGLHLTFLWLLALVLVFLWNCRQQTSVDRYSAIGSGVSARWKSLRSADGLLRLGLAVFVIGVWVSTWNVFRVSGDRRAALNLAFAWTGIAACGCLCRMLSRYSEGRRDIVNSIAGLSVGLAVFGIWQNQVFYPAESEAYLERLRVLESGTDPLQVFSVRRELLSTGIPLDGPGRVLMENRLLHSSEPFGLFALANTLAGVLAVGLVILTGGLISEWRSCRRRWCHLSIPFIASLVVAWCLILTKSRTAWVGAAVGVTVLLLRWSGDVQASGFAVRRWIRIVVTIGLPSVLLLATASAFEVIDLPVFLESLRSLQFRFFYWLGAAGVIGDEPIFGAGPGNFRQLYLAHKSVHSSESIMDPHNFLLDAWCFAGLPGFLGMALLVAAVMRSAWSGTDCRRTMPRGIPVSIVWGFPGCAVLHFGWLWISGVIFGVQHLMTAVVVVIAGGITLVLGRFPVNPVAAAAASITLLVHLLGAGGLQITTLWFLLIALATAALPESQYVTVRSAGLSSRVRWLLSAAGWATVAAAVLMWGLNPVISSSRQLGIGQQRFRNGDNRGATDAFQKAVSADPLSPTMRQHFAAAKTYPLMRRNPQKSPAAGDQLTDEDVQAAESACSRCIDSDTRAISGHLLRARFYYQLYRLTDQNRYIEFCLDDFRHVVASHPTSARLQAEFAICQETAGQTAAAAKTARCTMEIEAVNQAWRHRDQYLTVDQLEALKRIINGEKQ